MKIRMFRPDSAQRQLLRAAHCVIQCDNTMWDLIECSNTAHEFLCLLQSKTSTDARQKESRDKSTILNKHFTTIAKCENNQQVHEKLKIKILLQEVTAKERYVIRTRCSSIAFHCYCRWRWSIVAPIVFERMMRFVSSNDASNDVNGKKNTPGKCIFLNVILMTITKRDWFNSLSHCKVHDVDLRKETEQ